MQSCRKVRKISEDYRDFIASRIRSGTFCKIFRVFARKIKHFTGTNEKSLWHKIASLLFLESKCETHFYVKARHKEFKISLARFFHFTVGFSFPKKFASNTFWEPLFEIERLIDFRT